MKKYLLGAYLVLTAWWAMHGQWMQGDRMFQVQLNYFGRWHKEKKIRNYLKIEERELDQWIKMQYDLSFPMLEAGYGWLVNDQIEVGLNVGYFSAFYQWSGRIKIGDSTSNNYADARMTVDHYQGFLEPYGKWYFVNDYRLRAYAMLKIYGGLQIFNFRLHEYSSNDNPADVHLFLPLPAGGFTIMLGGQYMLTEHLGVFLEAGYRHSFVNGGLLFRL